MVTEYDSKLINKDWISGTSKYPINKELSKEDADYALQVADSGTKTPGVGGEWIVLEDQEKNAIFANLEDNPEEFTGFNGIDLSVIYLGSHIWNDIYNENCFNVKFGVTCNEEKLLYRLISGIHTNINMHITQYWGDKHLDYHYPDHLEFYNRVGAHKDRLENLYFAFKFILSAYDKLNDHFPDFIYTKYNKTENAILKNIMKDLDSTFLSTNFKAINENQILSTVTKEEFSSQVQPIFFNITKLVDCVTCEKCKLHGKLQFNGMSAAMKVMFPHKSNSAITRNELVGFFNLLRKMSNSIKWYVCNIFLTV